MDQIPFLKDNYETTTESFDADVTIYKIKKLHDGISSEMKTLEKCGFVKIIKEVIEIETADDILPMTKKVEKTKSSPMYLKVFFPASSFLLSENELMSTLAFKKCLLREGKFINISTKQWVEIVQAWLAMATEITEETEEDQLTDKVLNYLSNCVIYDSIDKAIARNTLFYDKEDADVVFCLIDPVMEVINIKKKLEVTSRKLRAMLSDYIDGNSIQRRIFNSKYRFWRFKVSKTNIDLSKQLFVEDEKDEKDNKDSGEAGDGQDHLSCE